MKNIRKLIIIVMTMLFISTITAFAADSVDFGNTGNITNQTLEDGSEWIVVNPGESGRGVIIQDENKNAVFTVDRYGAVYIKGKLFINDKEYTNSFKGAFTPINGFVYSLLAISLLLHVVSFMRRK
jgi:hypothetical protein